MRSQVASFEAQTPAVSAERREELAITAYRAYRDATFYTMQDAAEALSLLSDADIARWFAVVEHMRARLKPHEVQG